MGNDLVKWFKFDVSARIQNLLFDALAATRGADVRFVQVGANDGLTKDPVRPYALKYGWYGIAIEPVGMFFEQLTANYAHTDRVICVQALCARARQDIAFFEIKDATRLESPEMRGLSSTYRTVIRGHFATEAAFHKRVAERMVTAVPLDDILAEHGVQRIDLLVIDAEGADFDVLCGFDIRRYLPGLIMLEHYHLAQTDRHALHRLMRDTGYQSVVGAMDSFFYRSDAIDPETSRLLAAFHAVELSWTWSDNHLAD
jgi:FkbM family methyltransferase